MDPEQVNTILETLTNPETDISALPAADLTAHRAVLDEYRTALIAGLTDGTVTADSETTDASAALIAAITSIDDEVQRRADAAADLLSQLGGPATSEDPGSETVPDVVDTADPAADGTAAGAEIEPVAAQRFRLPDVPAVVHASREPASDPAETTTSVPALQFYASRERVAPNAAPMSEAEFQESWATAVGRTAGGERGLIAIARERVDHGVRLTDANAKDGSVFRLAYDRWKATRASRLVANRPGATSLSEGRAITAASCVAPARPVMDVAGPCPYTSWLDDVPTIETTEKVAIYPPLMTNYSALDPSTGGAGYVSEADDAAGYDPDGPTKPKHCDNECPKPVIACDPYAVYWCAERPSFGSVFWPSAYAASEQLLMNNAAVLRDWAALETLFDPTGTNDMVVKPQPLAVSDFGIALDGLNWIDMALAAIKACYGCDADMLMLPDWLLRRIVTDTKHRFGATLRESIAEVYTALGADDGMTIRTFSTSLKTWLKSGLPAELSGGEPLSPRCIGDGDDLLKVLPARAPIIVGFSDGLYHARHAEISLSAQYPERNTARYLSETISSVCLTKPAMVLDVPVCVRGATGAMVATTCP